MAADQINLSFIESSTFPAQAELRVSALLHRMSHDTASACESGCWIKLASVIESHLKAVTDLLNLASVLRTTCQQLSEKSAEDVESAMSKPEKINCFARIIVSTKHE